MKWSQWRKEAGFKPNQILYTSRQIHSRTNIPEEDIDRLLKNYSKRANARLAQIEKEIPSYQRIGAYNWLEKQQFDEAEYLKSDKIRFKTNIKGRTYEEKLEEVKRLDTFLFNTTTGTSSQLKHFNERLFEKIKKSRKFTEEQKEKLKDNTYQSFGTIIGSYSWKQLAAAKYTSEQRLDIIQSAGDDGIAVEMLDKVIDELISMINNPDVLAMKRNISQNSRAIADGTWHRE